MRTLEPMCIDYGGAWKLWGIALGPVWLSHVAAPILRVLCGPAAVLHRAQYYPQPSTLRPR